MRVGVFLVHVGGFLCVSEVFWCVSEVKSRQEPSGIVRNRQEPSKILRNRQEPSGTFKYWLFGGVLKASETILTLSDPRCLCRDSRINTADRIITFGPGYTPLSRINTGDWTSSAAPLFRHGISSAAPLFGHGTSSAAPLFGNGTSSAAPLFGHGTSSAAPLFGHGTSSAAPLFRHGTSSAAPLFGHGTSSAAPLFGHGAFGVRGQDPKALGPPGAAPRGHAGGPRGWGLGRSGGLWAHAGALGVV